VFVAARVAEIDFAVVDHGVAPIGDVERAVGAVLHVDWAEAYVAGAEQIGLLFGHVAAARVLFVERQILDRESHDAMCAEVASDRIALPLGGKMRRVDQLKAAEFRVIAGRDARRDFASVFIGEIHRARDAPGDALEAGAIGQERLAPLIPRVSPRIAEALEEHLDALGARIVGEDAA
jgi:hypothetical protein